MTALVAAGVLALLPMSDAAAATRTFPDAVGDSGASSDIQWVRVTNSAASDRFTVRVGLDRVEYGVALNVYVDLQRRNPGPELRMSAYADSEWTLFRVQRWGQRGREIAGCGRVTYSKSTDWSMALWRATRTCLGVGPRVRVAVRLAEPGVGVDWAPARRTFFPPVSSVG